MSEETVEAVRALADALNRGDVEAIVDRLDSSVEWHPATQALLGGESVTYRGHDGVREMMRDFYETFAEIRFEISDLQDTSDRVLASGQLHVRGKESGANTGSPVAYLVDFRGGKVIRVRDYLDPVEALEAAKLSTE